ncbi:nucleoside hydrolase [Lacticaseibacillus nasuensis]|uniref:nucleoside hydrolase n=1 Tax=Lacticaseibacillus nasuensis TaxID=944671 RepID=UPI0022481E45|nr:nucleoside hydrolase [Lacticaseibacillus nasuensis]MCX2456027.1 nucleoside hydrolase [Lacticaseibacillus nasuensis]
MKKKVIIDCDPGMDDSMAIVLACKSNQLDVLAVTTVNGNYPVAVTQINARKTLEMIGHEEITVAAGLGKPLVRETPKDPFTHGKDGQGENFLPAPTMPLSNQHAVDVIIELVRANPGEITLICCGPLSNIALAFIKAPDIKDKIKEIVAISGAFGITKYAYINATGDNPQSEWNVFVDPEAADIVYNSGVSFTAIGLDIATHFDVDFTEGQLKAIQECDHREAQFLAQAIKFTHNRGYGAYTTIIDCLAPAFVIAPEIFTVFQGKVGIELGGKYSVGNTVLERRAHHAWDNMTTIDIADSLDYPKLLEMIVHAVVEPRR